MISRLEAQQIDAIIRPLVQRIRALETIQEGNGFVPYWFPVQADDYTAHGTHVGGVLNAGGQSTYIEITMPRKTVNLVEAVLVFIPAGTGTIDYTVDTSGGYCGEDESTHTDSITEDGYAVTDDEITCLDITDALTPYLVGDIVGVKFTLDALSTTTDINVLGVRLR